MVITKHKNEKYFFMLRENLIVILMNFENETIWKYKVFVQKPNWFPIGFSPHSFRTAVSNLEWQHQEMAGELREMLKSLWKNPSWFFLWQYIPFHYSSTSNGYTKDNTKYILNKVIDFIMFNFLPKLMLTEIYLRTVMESYMDNRVLWKYFHKSLRFICYIKFTVYKYCKNILQKS